MPTEPTCPQCAAVVPLAAIAGLTHCPSCGSVLRRSTTDDEVAELRATQCPQCAGRLQVVRRSKLLDCAHCGVQVLVGSRDGLSKWHLPRRVDGSRAVRLAGEWLERQSGIAKASRNTAFTSRELVYIPIWEYTSLLIGWELGHRYRTRAELVGEPDNERLELEVVREKVEDPHIQERRFCESAADLARLGVTRPRITGREPLLPLWEGEIEEEARLLEPAGDEASMLARGREVVLRLTSAASGLEAHLSSVRENINLLFYPLWVLHYQYNGRVYQVVVNGYDGSVNAATAPAARLDQAWRLGPRLTPYLGAAGGLAVVAMLWSPARIMAIVVAVIVLLVAAVVASQFRMQEEVEYHDPFSS